ncbi:hypothetical protein BDV18DRAFT_155963 [Aspergillus unguis]
MLDALKTVFDEVRKDGIVANRVTSYQGHIGAHEAVAAYLPGGEKGDRAERFRRTITHFPSIRFIIVAGTAGAAPKHARLGVIVVNNVKVAQWASYGREQRLAQLDDLPAPPKILLEALDTLQAQGAKTLGKVTQFAHNLGLENGKYRRPPSSSDVLFKADYKHTGAGTCRNCDRAETIDRAPRDLKVHYGLIASGPLFRDGILREEINGMLGGEVLCFDTDAWKLDQAFPSIHIRGMSNYTDSHFADYTWYEHALALAAVFSKELLLQVPANEVEQMQTVQSFLRPSSKTYSGKM